MLRYWYFSNYNVKKKEALKVEIHFLIEANIEAMIVKFEDIMMSDNFISVKGDSDNIFVVPMSNIKSINIKY